MATHTYPTTPNTGKAMTPDDFHCELHQISQSLNDQAALVYQRNGGTGLEYTLLLLAQRCKELAEAEVRYE